MKLTLEESMRLAAPLPPLTPKRSEPGPWQLAAEQYARQKMAFIGQHRERLIEAWIAETGLQPSETVLVSQDILEPDGTMRTRMWVEKKRPEDKVR